MEKIMDKEGNELGLAVYMNCHIDISQIPEVILDSLLSGIEVDIAKHYAKKEKRKNQRKKDT